MNTVKEVLAANRTMIMSKLNTQLGNGTQETMKLIMTDFMPFCIENEVLTAHDIEWAIKEFSTEHRGEYTCPVQLNYDVMNMHKANNAACNGKI